MRNSRWCLFSMYLFLSNEKQPIWEHLCDKKHWYFSSMMFSTGLLLWREPVKQTMQGKYQLLLVLHLHFLTFTFECHTSQWRKNDWNFTSGNVDDIWNVKQSIIPWKKNIFSNFLTNKRKAGGYLLKDLPQEWSGVRHTRFLPHMLSGSFSLSRLP